MPPANLVMTSQSYQSMLEHLWQQEAIALDTESNNLFAYQERVCLIQISSTKQDFLLDPFAFDELEELGHLMADEKIQKIMHAGDYDISTLKRDYDFTFKNVFDTMLAAQATGETNIGLGTLLEKYFEINLSKKYQRADWGKRPLEPDMLSYAQADSHYLITLRDYLVPILVERGWYELVLEESNAMAKLIPPMQLHSENVWRIKGSRSLKRKERGLLEQLNHQRELVAKDLNRPLFKIFSDKVLIQLTEEKPSNLDQLEELKILSPRQLKKHGQWVIDTINQWLKNPTVLKRPDVCKVREPELGRRSSLLEWRKELAKQENVTTNLILSRDLLDAIAKPKTLTIESLKEIMIDYPLRFKRFGNQIYEHLKRSEK